MKYILCLLLTSIQFTYAQKIRKADKIILSNLENHVAYLSDDKLEGRRTGSTGEKLAYEYIIEQFKNAAFSPKGDSNDYLQQFSIYEGREVNPVSHLLVNGHDLKIHEEYFPFSFSPDTSLEAWASVSLHENENPWFYDIRELMDTLSVNPHYNLLEGIKHKALYAAKKGANAFFVYNSGSKEDGLKFDPNRPAEMLPIPVLYISSEAKKKYFGDETATVDVKFKIAVKDKIRYGYNVIGYIDNAAENTIVIGAHYDHLGYGEDHNSLAAGGQPQIHNGADDNASGVSGVIELGKMLKQGKYTNNNYLLVAFSGEELGLIGSKYFTEHPTIDLNQVNFMINLDMIGRLKDDSKTLSIGGYGTSPAWAKVLLFKNKYLKLNLDSSGTGPSDHTSFYRKNIPVLFFFTGAHADYHKPTDDADKINYIGELTILKFIYKVIENVNKTGKLAFTRTRETNINSLSRFSVTLGIMPDYSYPGPGVKTDGVTEGRVAQKAGIVPGDVIIQLGEYSFSDLQEYMETLNKFKKGDTTQVKVKRGGEELIFNIIF